MPVPLPPPPLVARTLWSCTLKRSGRRELWVDWRGGGAGMKMVLVHDTLDCCIPFMGSCWFPNEGIRFRKLLPISPSFLLSTPHSLSAPPSFSLSDRHRPGPAGTESALQISSLLHHRIQRETAQPVFAARRLHCSNLHGGEHLGGGARLLIKGFPVAWVFPVYCTYRYVC